MVELDHIKDQETLIKAYSKVNKKCNLLLVGDIKRKNKRTNCSKFWPKSKKDFLWFKQ